MYKKIKAALRCPDKVERLKIAIGYILIVLPALALLCCTLYILS